MTLVAFIQAQNCSNLVASWRHPNTELGYATPEFYQDIARTLERGRFQMAFFDDRLAMPDRYGDDHRATVEHGVRAVKLDPVAIATIMSMATRRLGLGATYSTTYYEPFHVARVFATLDLLSRGRIAWTVVTSLNDSEAANFGALTHLDHDLRYERADEFLEVVQGHWDTWEEGALIHDKAAGRFADGAKVKRLDHAGEWFKSRGPFTVPRSPQGSPVLIQAGQSGRGSEFAARWADLVFVIYPNIDVARKSYAAFKHQVAAHGRDVSKVRVAPAIYVIAGESRAEAEDKKAVVDSMVDPMDGLILLSEVLNFDFAAKDPQDPFTDDELQSITGLRAILDRVVTLSGNSHPSVADFLHYSGRGTTRELPTFVGSKTDVADELEEWFTSGACDGFVLAATSLPGTYTEFVELIVPELQRRGLFHADYEGPTLRDNLGLVKPRAGEWKTLYT
jgi:FMN-dependent oxidoreductase (nitrilotriacetate monooxygenase family)